MSSKGFVSQRFEVKQGGGFGHDLLLLKWKMENEMKTQGFFFCLASVEHWMVAYEDGRFLLAHFLNSFLVFEWEKDTSYEALANLLLGRRIGSWSGLLSYKWWMNHQNAYFHEVPERSLWKIGPEFPGESLSSCHLESILFSGEPCWFQFQNRFLPGSIWQSIIVLQ